MMGTLATATPSLHLSPPVCKRKEIGLDPSSASSGGEEEEEDRWMLVGSKPD